MITLRQINNYADKIGNKTSIIDDNHSLTWKDYATLVDQRSKQLASLVTKDATALVWTDPTIDLIICASALATLGIPWVGLSPSESENSCRQKASILNPSIVIDLPGCRPIIHPRATLITNEYFSCDFPESESLAHYKQPKFRSFGFTSGTSGQPKLAVRTESFENRRLSTMQRFFHFTPDDTFLETIPIAHASGHGWIRTLLASGASIRLTKETTSKNISEIIINERITTSLMVPPTLNSVIKFFEECRRKPTSIRWILTGGRHITNDLVSRSEKVFGRDALHLYYGTTETGVNTLAFPSDLQHSPTSAGRPFDGNKIKILDDNKKPISSGPGRISICSYMNFSGYTSGPGDTIDIDGDSYVITTDRGFIDDDKRLHILSRQDGVSEKTNIPLVEIESNITDLSGISESAALLIRENSEKSPTLNVFVVPSKKTHIDISGVHSSIIKTLRDSCHSCVAVKVIPISRIPYGETGKVDARKLAELFPRHEEGVS